MMGEVLNIDDVMSRCYYCSKAVDDQCADGAGNLICSECRHKDWLDFMDDHDRTSP